MEPKAIEAQREVRSVKKVVAPGTTYQMKKEDKYVETSTTSGNNVALTLPPLGKAEGRMYYIFCTSYDTGTLTITSGDSYFDDNDSTQSQTMDASDEYILLYCTGFNWVTCATNIS